MTTWKSILLCLGVVLLTPELARANAATCNDYSACFANPGSPCESSDYLMGVALGGVNAIGELLCFVGDAKCSCYQRISDANAPGPEFDDWLGRLGGLVGSCAGTNSGNRSLTGLAFEAANAVCTPSAPSYAADVAPILEGTCGVCHINIASGEFRFANGRSDLVNVPSTQSPLVYVSPGNVDQSYLWHKINGTQLSVGGSGTRMPQGGVLPQQDIDTIGAWIGGGALP